MSCNDSAGCSFHLAQFTSQRASTTTRGGRPERCTLRGLSRGDIVLNTFSYHLVPGGFIMDGGARCLGCTVIPAGPGNTEQQLDIIEQLKPVAYTGTPDFLKILLDAGDSAGRDVSSISKAVVSGAAFPPSLQAVIKARGIDAFQAYAIADVGVIAYESRAREGLIVNEDVLIEIVRPGTARRWPMVRWARLS